MPNVPLYRAMSCLLRGISRVLWDVRPAGRENVPATGGVILACTHESFLDPLVVGCFAPRWAWHMARRTLFFSGDRRSRFRTWLGKVFGVIEVDRDGTGLAALRGAEEKLRAGEVVILFPEGTRSLDGAVLPFKAGIGLLALRTGAAVVPISLAGTRRVWPKGRSLPGIRRGPVHLVYGPAVRYAHEERHAREERCAREERHAREDAGAARTEDDRTDDPIDDPVDDGACAAKHVPVVRTTGPKDVADDVRRRVEALRTESS